MGPLAAAAATCALGALALHAAAPGLPRGPSEAELAAVAARDSAREARAVLAALGVAPAGDRAALERVLAASTARLRADVEATGDAGLADACGRALDSSSSRAPDGAGLADVEGRADRLAAALQSLAERETARRTGLAVSLLLGAGALSGGVGAAAAGSVRRERRRLDAVLPPGAPGEGLEARAERLTGKARHAIAQQVSLVGERVELGRALAEQQVVEERLRREVRQNRDRIEKLEVSQMNDELTGVLNFKYFLLRLAEALDDFVAAGRPFCLLALDLDDFKGINDGYGHHVGDAALKEMARVLKATVRSDDVVFRKSGDEFYVLMPGAGPEHGEALAERLLAAVNGHEVVYVSTADTYRVALATSIGVLHCSEVDPELLGGLARDQLLSETYGFADAALFKAKFSGKGCARIYRTGLTVRGVNPEEYPPEFDQLHRELRSRYPLLPEEARDDFNAHVAACRSLLDPQGHRPRAAHPR